jgi:hypothetical protein
MSDTQLQAAGVAPGANNSASSAPQGADPFAALGATPAPAPTPKTQDDPFAALGATPAPAPTRATPTAPPATGFVAGVKRNTVDALTALYHGFNDPATEQEKADMLSKIRDENTKSAGDGNKIPESFATNPSRATLALHRIIDAPADVLAKKGRDEVGVAQDLINNHQYWRGGNLYLSGLADRALSAIPVLGPVINSIGERGEGALIPAYDKQRNRIATSDVPADRKDFSGAAADVGSLVALGHAPAITKAGSEVVGDAAQIAKAKLADAHASIKSAFITPEPPIPTPPTPKPVAAHVEVDTPFDNAVIRKLGGGELKPEAADVIRQHAGDTIPAGSSPQNHLMKTVAPINKTISDQGLALNKVLEDAGNLSISPKANVDAALNEFRKNLPGGTEEQFGKAIDKERARIDAALDSTDPLEVNSVKRDLDKRIKDYTKPEKPMNNPSDAAEAARVIMRRSLSDTLSQEIPATKPINQELAKNLEARGFLADKLKDVAYDPVEADAQHKSEFQKGKTIVDNQATDAVAKADYDVKVAQVKKNVGRLRIGVGGLGLAYYHDKIAKLLELLP